MFKFLIVDNYRGVTEQCGTLEDLIKYLSNCDESGELLEGGDIIVYGAKYDVSSGKFGLDVVAVTRVVTFKVEDGFN